MKMRRVAAVILTVMLASAAGACSVAPRYKTVVLPRPKPSPTATLTPSGSIAFEWEKATVIPAGTFDTAGYFSTGTQFVYGWLDNDHLAAIGVKPVASPSATTESADLEQRSPKAIPAPAEIAPVSTRGLVGQILSVDWQTGKTSEVHTVQDEVILSVGVSHDRTRLWFTSIGADGAGKLMVTDISFKHVLLEVTNYLTVSLPVWSSGDKYLGYFSYEKKNLPMLNLFDGTESNAYYISDIKPIMNQEIIGIQDDTGDLLLRQAGSMLAELNLNQDLKRMAISGEKSIAGIFAPPQRVSGAAAQAALTAGGLLLYLSAENDARQLTVADINTLKPLQSYDGVINFALSDDHKYICLVRRTVGTSADVSIAEWRGGKLANEKVVFKGFIADGNIFFSPDNAKLYLEGNYGYSRPSKTCMILKFK